jgi:polyisoprenoid-binding protein YceI
MQRSRSPSWPAPETGCATGGWSGETSMGRGSVTDVGAAVAPGLGPWPHAITRTAATTTARDASAMIDPRPSHSHSCRWRPTVSTLTVPTFDPDSDATCEVLVFRDGLLSPIAHDLQLRAASFEIVIEPEAPRVSVTVDATSLRVVTALRDGRPLPGALRPRDVREIEGTIVDEVLQARRFPAVAYRSRSVTRRDDGFDVEGELTLHGATRPLALPVHRREGRLVVETHLDQRQFGIRPYSAMLGTLKVKATVVVRATLPATGVTLLP